MSDAIVINTSNQASVAAQAVEALQSQGIQQPVLIARNRPQDWSSTGDTFLSCASASLTSCLRVSFEKSRSDRIIIINADALPTNARGLPKMVSALLSENTSETLNYVPLEAAGEIIDFPDSEVDGLIATLNQNAPTAVVAISVKRSFLMEHSDLESHSGREFMMKLFLAATAEGESVSATSYVIEADVTSMPIGALQLNNAESARAMKLVVANCNIEDLFPRHSWTEHKAESVAACYHTLAAFFVQREDLDSAIECLAYSDELEDSPRSLALKGLIALKRGETLGAVAQLISSLQQYEVRKRENDSHYLSFNPKDFEKINTSLSAGLEALNRRDNDQALQHFAQAVFEFDPFYREMGVTEVNPAT